MLMLAFTFARTGLYFDNQQRASTMENTDTSMKRVMTYLFAGLFGVFFSIILLANTIA